MLGHLLLWESLNFSGALVRDVFRGGLKEVLMGMGNPSGRRNGKPSKGNGMGGVSFLEGLMSRLGLGCGPAGASGGASAVPEAYISCDWRVPSVSARRKGEFLFTHSSSLKRQPKSLKSIL
jgi:hypothetical protein